MTVPLLELRGISMIYRVGIQRIPTLKAIDLEIGRGETLAVVGESGSGKTTLAKIILGLERPTAGSVRLDGQELTIRRSRETRRQIQVVQQNPLSALNPAKTVGSTITLPLAVHGYPREGRDRRIAELLDIVGLPPALALHYPNDLSGGQRQRVALARALASNPDLLVLDEPTSALDVSVQAKMLRLLRELQVKHRVAYCFITHDLAVARALAQRVVVLRGGSIVDKGEIGSVFTSSRNGYTRELLAAVPTIK